jgi:uncharacterized protein YdaU (DUF1376 family)
MHYYKRNLGDYAKKAGRLSMLQHGSYTLLIDSCYDREQFPTRDEAIEWTWASTKDEIEAVDFVLRKFFTLEEGLYVQKRVQEEISEYYLKAETNKRVAMDRETNRKKLKAAGIVGDESVAKRERNVNETIPKDESVTKRERNVNESTPNHKPITNNQEPITNNQKPPASNTAIQPALEEGDSALGVTAVSLSIALRSAGVKSQPADPRLIELARQGVLPETLQAACAEAANSKPGEVVSLGYVLGIVERWSREAARLNGGGAGVPSGSVVAHIRPEKFNPTAHVNRQRKAQ